MRALIPEVKMRGKSIFVVMAIIEYESATPVVAFEDAGAASAFVARCTAYQSTAPEGPGVIEDTAENDAAHKVWHEKYDRWRKRHPAGEDNSWAGLFSVSVVPLKSGGAS